MWYTRVFFFAVVVSTSIFFRVCYAVQNHRPHHHNFGGYCDSYRDPCFISWSWSCTGGRIINMITLTVSHVHDKLRAMGISWRIYPLQLSRPRRAAPLRPRGTGSPSASSRALCPPDDQRVVVVYCSFLILAVVWRSYRQVLVGTLVLLGNEFVFTVHDFQGRFVFVH